jgi:hypothetical protein
VRSEKHLSRIIVGLQIAILISGVAAFFLPIIVVLVAVLGFTLYLLTQKRDALKDARLRAEIEDGLKDRGGVTINGKPVTY